MSIKEELNELNYQFLANNRNGIKTNDQNYLKGLGEIPILISAPHAVKQERENMTKPSDYLTGALALYLSKKLNCSYFIRSYNMNDDPNYPIGITLNQIESNYLKALKEFILKNRQFLVIDLHGCSNKRLYDASIWTNYFATCQKEIVQIFGNYFLANNFTVDMLGQEFQGGQVTRQCGLITNAFQLELRRDLRTIEDESTLARVIETFYSSINETYEYTLKLEKRIDF